MPFRQRAKNYVLVHFLPLYPRSYLRFAPLSEALFFNEDKSNAMRARKNATFIYLRGESFGVRLLQVLKIHMRKIPHALAPSGDSA
jgi:hypothetical protein